MTLRAARRGSMGSSAMSHELLTSVIPSLPEPLQPQPLTIQNLYTNSQKYIYIRVSTPLFMLVPCNLHLKQQQSVSQSIIPSPNKYPRLQTTVDHNSNCLKFGTGAQTHPKTCNVTIDIFRGGQLVKGKVEEYEWEDDYQEEGKSSDAIIVLLNDAGPVGDAADGGDFMPLVAVEEVGESRYIMERVVRINLASMS
ncbi:hypothetical protein NA56DRAFT_707680 [Hyaloscypha hepaticicola]|uniref:Uncharacterized protein n=1 Tax=Hyaloscypha hepaticicola TaxID=2082293 RepID=A0A2J6PU32_9HELO|nr:hypothetical protein NA56DRAFT_707680 [Hyaloscypha hepaticicola]